MFSGETREVAFGIGRKNTRSNKARREARAGGARNVVFDAVPDADNPSRGDAGDQGLGVPVYCGWGLPNQRTGPPSASYASAMLRRPAPSRRPSPVYGSRDSCAFRGRRGLETARLKGQLVRQVHLPV